MGLLPVGLGAWLLADAPTACRAIAASLKDKISRKIK
jgi:hypothetical protein